MSIFFVFFVIAGWIAEMLFFALLNLKRCNCRVSDGVLQIHIEMSETDQLRQRDEMLIAKWG